MTPLQIFTFAKVRCKRTLQFARDFGNQAVAGMSLLLEPIRERVISAASGQGRAAGKRSAVVFIDVERHRRGFRQISSKRRHVATAYMDEIVASLARDIADAL